MIAEVVIDCMPEAVRRYGKGWTIVAVDVIRATTTAVTAAWHGHPVFPVASLAEANAVADRLKNPLLVGEIAGERPGGFDETNSPAALAARADVERPIVLLSTNGTRLLREAGHRGGQVYAACLRNASAQADWLMGRHPQVVLIGAGARDGFRIEDQYCCARIASTLMRAGYRPGGLTEHVVDLWTGLPPDVIAGGRSASFLRESGQLPDLEFVLTHVDDVPAVFRVRGTQQCLVGNRVGPASESGDEAEVVSA